MSKRVTKEQARILENLGFSFKTKVIDNVDDFGRWYKDIVDIFPTVSEALQWIREKKGVRIKFYVQCHYSCSLRDVVYQGIITNDAALIIKQRTTEFLTHPEAETALLDAVLTYLIEKK